MSESDNVELLKRAFAAFDAGDIPGVLSAFADNVDWNNPVVKGVPHSGPRHGLNEIRQFFDTLAEAEEPEEFARNEFIAQGDKVAVLGTYRARVKSTGRVYESPLSQVWTIRNGKIQKLDQFFDTALQAEAYRP